MWLMTLYLAAAGGITAPADLEAVARVYPGFQVVADCRGAHVYGILDPASGKVRRVGVIDGVVHDIDDELKKDEDVSRSLPMRWHTTLDEKGFRGDIRCGGMGEALEEEPLFDLGKAGLRKEDVVCFATDDVYDNWDCVVWSPKDGRFRLWYQKAHAD